MKTLCKIDVRPLVKALQPLLAGDNEPSWGVAWRWLAGGEPGTYATLQSGSSHSKAEFTWPPLFPAETFCAKLMEYYPGKRQGEINLSRIVPGQIIADHSDDLEGGCQIRVHIPIVTNPKAMFREKGKPHHMAVGHAYEINPAKQHGVVNNGKTDRIHLMFNVLK